MVTSRHSIKRGRMAATVTVALALAVLLLLVMGAEHPINGN